MEFLAEGSCRFSGNTDHAETVYTVGGDLELEGHIIESQGCNGIGSHFCILRENINAVLRCFRVHLSGGAQLLDGAHHTIGLDAAELAFLDHNAALGHLTVMIACHTSAVEHHRNLISLFYIGGTCHDLCHLTVSDIYLADDQLVCVRMLLDFFNLTNHDLVQITVCRLKSLNLCSGQSHGIRKLLCRHIQIRYICFYP